MAENKLPYHVKIKEFTVVVSDGVKTYGLNLLGFGSAEYPVNGRSCERICEALEKWGFDMKNNYVVKLTVNGITMKTNFEKTGVEFVKDVYRSGIIRYWGASKRFCDTMDAQGLKAALKDMFGKVDGKKQNGAHSAV